MDTFCDWERQKPQYSRQSSIHFTFPPYIGMKGEELKRRPHNVFSHGPETCTDEPLKDSTKSWTPASQFKQVINCFSLLSIKVRH